MAELERALNPDVDVDEEEDTLYPFLQHGGLRTLHYALRATYWPGIALIPANLGLYDAEYEFAARMARDPAFILDRVREGVASIADQFDIILMDPPPALGMLSLSALRAANALLIPAPPNNIDFASTAHFLKMMESTLAELARHGGIREYSFVKILTSKMNDQKSVHQALTRSLNTTTLTPPGLTMLGKIMPACPAPSTKSPSTQVGGSICRSNFRCRQSSCQLCHRSSQGSPRYSFRRSTRFRSATV